MFLPAVNREKMVPQVQMEILAHKLWMVSLEMSDTRDHWDHLDLQ